MRPVDRSSDALDATTAAHQIEVEEQLIDAKSYTKDLLEQVIHELRLLNQRFEEAFDTKINSGDIQDED